MNLDTQLRIFMDILDFAAANPAPILISEKKVGILAAGWRRVKGIFVKPEPVEPPEVAPVDPREALYTILNAAVTAWNALSAEQRVIVAEAVKSAGGRVG